MGPKCFCGRYMARTAYGFVCGPCDSANAGPEPSKPEPTIPLTQVEAMLLDAVVVGSYGLTQAEIDKWIANKIKEARQ